VLVDVAVLQLVKNALKRDAEKGLAIRGEILQELEKNTFPYEPYFDLTHLSKKDPKGGG